MRIGLFALALLVICSCGGKSSRYDFEIAFDPSWHSFNLPGRETSLTLFTLELVEAIGKEEGISLGIFNQGWSSLMFGLQQGSYNAIPSTMQPYLFYQKMYDFSQPYLLTGPVLVVAVNSSQQSLDQMTGKIVGIIQGSSSALILEKYPGIIQRTYGSIQAALIDTAKGSIDGAIVDILTAEAFTQDLFQGQLKIASAPLTQEGIRLVALHGQADALIDHFNRGLASMKKKGTYSALLKKWNLGLD